MQPRDILDIILVATLFYLIFLLLRESRSAVALRHDRHSGRLADRLFLRVRMRLTALLVVFKNFWVIVILVFIVVFQHDFRRSLTQVGQFAPLPPPLQPERRYLRKSSKPCG